MVLFWDASGLAKRYIAEQGSDSVDALFAGVKASDMATTPWGYAETYSILLRRHNNGILDLTSFQNAVVLLQNEVFHNSDFTLSPIIDAMIFASLATMHKHNLN